MRKLKYLLGIPIILVLGWVLVVLLSVIYPPQGDLESPKDAVVSLSPQHYRLPLAEEVLVNTDTPTLVISYVEPGPGHVGTSAPPPPDAAIEYCELEAPMNVVCFTPQEISTIGEAYSINDLIQQESWDSVTIVTSKWHTFRTRFLFSQCIDDDVDVNIVYPEPEMTAKQWTHHLAYENAAFVKALYEGVFRY